MFGWLKSSLAGIRSFFATRSSPRLALVPKTQKKLIQIIDWSS
jgi:hypothetical protein